MSSAESCVHAGSWLRRGRKGCAGMADPLPETRWCPGASWSRGGQAAQSKGHGQGLCQWTGLSSSSAETRGFVSLCKSEKGAAGCVYICQRLCVVGGYLRPCLAWFHHRQGCPLTREGERLRLVAQPLFPRLALCHGSLLETNPGGGALSHSGSGHVPRQTRTISLHITSLMILSFGVWK